MTEWKSLEELQMELPDFKKGDMVDINIASQRPNHVVHKMCGRADFRILYNGTVYCQRCKLVVGKYKELNDGEVIKGVSKSKKPAPKLNEEEDNTIVNHCEAHERFIPSCPACLIKNAEAKAHGKV